jgi:hypothetical protein
MHTVNVRTACLVHKGCTSFLINVKPQEHNWEACIDFFELNYIAVHVPYKGKFGRSLVIILHLIGMGESDFCGMKVT